MEISTLPLPPDRCDPAGRDALALTVCGASVPGRRAYNTVLVQNFFEELRQVVPPLPSSVRLEVPKEECQRWSGSSFP